MVPTIKAEKALNVCIKCSALKMNSRMTNNGRISLKFRELFLEYLEISSFHGIKFIVDDSSKPREKIFWTICVIASWIGSGFLIMASLDAFLYNAISFVVETSYLNWETDFPATVVCETKNLDRVEEISEELWGYDHDFILEEVLTEVAYFRGESYHTIHNCGEPDAPKDCIKVNFSAFARIVRSPCRNTIANCMWNDKSFDCCKYFQPMETELGICYALNSKQINNPRPPKLNMLSNQFTGPGNLKFEVLTDSNVYTLGEEEVPNLVTSKSDILVIGPYISYTRYISLRNIENDPQSRYVSIDQRNCRFSNENYLSVYKHYSYSACSVQCRRDHQLRMCNCTNHLMPNTDYREHCDINGLRCLNAHYEELSVVRAKWATAKRGVVCDCLPSCTENDILIVHNARSNIYGNQNPVSTVEIRLISLPTERYKRNIIRGKLDLVVSIGGTAGLFFGGSLLSIAEIIYYLLFRSLTTMVEQTNTVKIINRQSDMQAAI